MDTLDRLNQAFIEVGKRDGVADFRLSPNGTAGLQLRSGTRIFFEYVPNTSRLFIYCPLLKFPSGDTQGASLFKTALTLNFLNTNDDGQIAASEHFQELIYQRSFAAADLDGSRLDRTINEVIERRAEIMAHLEQKTGQGTGSKGADKMHHRRTFARMLERHQ